MSDESGANYYVDFVAFFSSSFCHNENKKYPDQHLTCVTKYP